MTTQVRLDPLSEEVHRYCALVEELLPRLDAEPVEDAGSALEQAVDWQPSWAALALQVLDARHAVEQKLQQGRPLEPDLELDLVEADEQLRPQLWRLTILNHARQDRLESLPQTDREGAWWYSLGAHLPAHAVAHLGEVASVVACFPEAERELRALARADEQLLPEAFMGGVNLSEAGLACAAELSSTAESFRSHLPAESVQDPDPFVAPAVGEEVWEGERLRLAGRRRWFRSVFLPWWAAAASVLCALSLGSVAYLRMAEQAREENARLLEEALRLKAESDAAVRRLESSMRNLDSMSAAQRAALEAQLQQAIEAARTAQRESQASGSVSRPLGSSAPGSTSSGHPASRRASPGPSSSCSPGDPVCGGL